MRRRFFAENMVRMLTLSLLPVLFLTLVFFSVLLPTEKKSLESEAEINLSLLQENVDLLLNDSNKVMNMLSVPAYSNSNSIYQILRSEQLKYLDFVILKQVAAQLNAIVNSRDYIDSIYVYIPNAKGRYLTNQANVYDMDSGPDQNWLSICSGDRAYRVIRRTASLSASASRDYLTVIQENSKGYTVAVNIVVSYFKRLFTNSYLENGHAIILSDGNNLLFSSNADINALDLINRLEALPDREGLIRLDSDLIMRSHSRNSGLDFLSVTPISIAYANIYRLITITCVTVFLCVLMSVIVSYRYAINVSGHLYAILDLMDAAISHKELPVIRQRSNDLYSHILTNMIQTFTQNDFLKTSLNEQKFQALSLELSALQYQINPHFLSNTLQMIDFEILKNARKPTTANEMIQDLSIFLKYSLLSPKEDVTMDQEIEATTHYMALMSHRYGGQVEVHWEVSPDVLSLQVPKLILQPMIENCVTHGNHNQADQLDIFILIAVREELLTIQVRDTGNGVSPEHLEELRMSLSEFSGFHEKHIGLQNLFRRLQLRFPADQCHITLDSRPGEGFCVTIYIKL
ncbi:sensor histidine kinase [Lacrimispora sp.]|uniref:sensor histidine kinase n=1 Tax=Lacrimispora sp. TaxID=2719234 RepID=UPI0028AF2A2F|nr:histidine kinase [Lacrimispora sp.]